MSQLDFNLPTNQSRKAYRFDPMMDPVELPQPKRIDYPQVIRDAIQKIAELDIVATALESKLARLSERLNDPKLTADVPFDDPRRLAALDRYDATEKTISEYRQAIWQYIADVDSAGRYVDESDLIQLGALTDQAVIERVHYTDPETKRMPVWQAIAGNVLPF